MTLDEKFDAYHTLNPEVYFLFKQFSVEARRAGRRHFGAKAIMERIRWHMLIETNGDHFKINNNYTSRYVRMLIAEMPEFNDFFQMRELKSRKAAA